MNELALFAGAGGGILGGKLLGWTTVCAVEVNAFCARRLMQRQNEGHLPPFPIWDDVCTFDGRPWRGVVDVVSGGFPCQDISAAGTGEGIDGARSGLWVEMARIIREVRPRFAFVENSPMLTSRGLGTVLGDLAAMGYDAEWGVLGAADVGAPHQRERVWIMAHAESIRSGSGLCQNKQEQNRDKSADSGGEMAHPNSERLEEQHPAAEPNQTRQYSGGIAEIRREEWWATEPNVGRVAHGVAHRVDRLQAIGNGQVPLCAAEAWTRLFGRIKEATPPRHIGA